MPHIYLEHTKNIKTEIKYDLYETIILHLSKTINIKPKNCKCRSIERIKFYIGDIKAKGFIHLTIKILEGRNEKKINNIGKQLLKLLQLYFKEDLKVNSFQLSVEIQEIKKTNYFTSNII